MFNFNVPRYERFLIDALAMRPEIERAADAISAEGYSNLFFIGCGGTYAHALPMQYWLETASNIEVHAEIAAEFMLMGHRAFSKDSVCIFSSRSGNTKEIVEAAKFCKEAGARTIVYVSNDNTPICEYADYKVSSFAEDDHLCEAIYTFMITLVARLMKNAGEFADYGLFMEEYAASRPTSCAPRSSMMAVAAKSPRASRGIPTTWSLAPACSGARPTTTRCASWKRCSGARPSPSTRLSSSMARWNWWKRTPASSSSMRGRDAAVDGPREALRRQVQRGRERL